MMIKRYRTNHLGDEIESDSLLELAIKSTARYASACAVTKSESRFEPVFKAVDYGLVPVVFFYCLTIGYFEYRQKQDNHKEMGMIDMKNDSIEKRVSQKENIMR